MALGKGLDALWGDTTLQDQAGGSVTIPVAQIEPGLNQPRKHFDEEALAGLAESIRQHGIIQPLTVRRLSSGYYQIIAGERRWRAARMAGLAEVPAIVIEADDRMVMELGLIENLQREDLNPMEEAAGYRSLIEDYGLTQEEAAQPSPTPCVFWPSPRRSSGSSSRATSPPGTAGRCSPCLRRRSRSPLPRRSWPTTGPSGRRRNASAASSTR